MPISKKRISTLVDLLLEENKIVRPPVPIDKLIRRKNIEIVFKRFEDPSSGFILINPNTRNPVIGVNSKHSETRQRFTMAHELGHFILHKHSGIHVDEDDFFVRFRDENSGLGTEPEEREANAFAAELLMPRQFVEADVRTRQRFSMLDETGLRDLAKRYGVSLQACMLRLVNLKLIDPSDIG
jgi:Zn-dependent peptidase ImmA (M78 family)